MLVPGGQGSTLIPNGLTGIMAEVQIPHQELVIYICIYIYAHTSYTYTHMCISTYIHMSQWLGVLAALAEDRALLPAATLGSS